MSKRTGRMQGRISDLRMKRKMERLALIKERYRRLIIEPRQRLEMELDRGDGAVVAVEEEHEYDRDHEMAMEDVIREYYGEDADGF